MPTINQTKHFFPAKPFKQDKLRESPMLNGSFVNFIERRSKVLAATSEQKILGAIELLHDPEKFEWFIS